MDLYHRFLRLTTLTKTLLKSMYFYSGIIRTTMQSYPLLLLCISASYIRLEHLRQVHRDGQ